MMTGKAIQGFFLSGQAPIVASESARAFGPVTRRMVQRSGGDGVYPITAVQLGLARGGGRPLSDVLLAKMEAAFGEDFSAVRVHVGPQASRIGAIAFTTGNDLYFAPGQYQPDTQKGQQLIGHELAHVIQQRRGRVRTLGSGLAIVQDRALEVRTADSIPSCPSGTANASWGHSAKKGPVQCHQGIDGRERR
jgi:hypothetical protein